jgi:hypothetical protein
MTEERYRLAVVILLSVFVIAFIILGTRFVQNGRYVQYDHQKDHVVFGGSMQNPQPAVIDSRTGAKKGLAQ